MARRILSSSWIALAFCLACHAGHVDTVECGTDADCRGEDSPGTGQLCSADHHCVECRSNTDCHEGLECVEG
ncbi:MAG TPA: hypothetical protein VF103_17475, partial [Polyangiaceae bacterium]